jgi:hypothetical protein
MYKPTAILSLKEAVITSALDDLSIVIALPNRKRREQIATVLSSLQVFPNNRRAYPPKTTGNGRREWAADCLVTIAKELLVLSILGYSSRQDAADRARLYLGNALQEIQTLLGK